MLLEGKKHQALKKCFSIFTIQKTSKVWCPYLLKECSALMMPVKTSEFSFHKQPHCKVSLSAVIVLIKVDKRSLMFFLGLAWGVCNRKTLTSCLEKILKCNDAYQKLNAVCL